MPCNGNNIIEFVFMYADEIKTAVHEKRNDPKGTQSGGNGSGHSRISDPTAMQALRAVDGVASVVVFFGPRIGTSQESLVLRNPEKWLQVVANTKKLFQGKPQLELIHRRFERGEHWKNICNDMHISKGAYYAMSADITHAAELFAVGLGCMSPWRKK